MGFCACGVGTVPMRNWWPSPVNAEGFARLVGPVVWRKRPPSWLNRSSRASPSAHGSSRFPSPSGICLPPSRSCSHPCCRSFTENKRGQTRLNRKGRSSFVKILALTESDSFYSRSPSSNALAPRPISIFTSIAWGSMASIASPTGSRSSSPSRHPRRSNSRPSSRESCNGC